MTERHIVLKGLNGSNPLSFMAALGCLRMATSGSSRVGLSWALDGQWRPALHGIESEPELLDRLQTASEDASKIPDLTEPLGENITVSTDDFRKFALAAALSSEWSPFAAAFGSDVTEDEKNKRIQCTKLCFITGSGHQNFLETIRQLRAKTTREHLRRALFEGVDAADRGLSMRWDPGDAKEYALQWANPGPEGVQSSWGAYRLAIEALPFFPAVPCGRWLKTTGFLKGRDNDEFRWPIWSDPLSAHAIRSLLANEDVIHGKSRATLRSRGIAELFACERVRIGEGANFKVSFRPSRPAVATGAW